MNKELYECYGISGHESCIREYIIKNIKDYCDGITVDSIGNLYAHKINGDYKKITLIANMDETGIIVTNVTEDGYIKFDTIGRLKPEFLVSKRVAIGEYTGIISLKAIHLTTKKERETPVKTADLFIDIGAKTKEEVLEKIDIGDYGKICSPTVQFGNKYIKGSALTGRWGCETIIDLIKENKICNFNIIFTSQREINNRGMAIAASNISSDLVIFLDSVPAKIWEKSTYPVSGCGAVIVKNSNTGMISPDIFNKLSSLAEDENISIQFFTGDFDTPDKSVKELGKNILSFVLAIPVKYIDSTSQVCSMADIESARKLLNAVINNL